MRRIRRIVHPSDFSRASQGAFAKAVELARDNGAELWLVHVLTPVIPMVGDGYISPKLYDDLEASARAYGQKELDKLVDKASKSKVRVKTALLEGIPHEQIIRAARSKHADLIVIGTHGRTGIAKLFLGSVAGRVVSTAPCPVMTVRGK
jgi:universal stress protein A